MFEVELDLLAEFIIGEEMNIQIGDYLSYAVNVYTFIYLIRAYVN